MEDNTSLNIFPKTRVKPFDGMSVTADTWSQAHEEHRQALRAHDLYFHGSGIICGLEVTANDPPDQLVFISPGAAVDPAGNVIVLTETVAYDFSASVEGSLYLVIGHGERESGGVEAEVKYTHDEFVIAARPSIPKRPVVELARIILTGAGKPIQPASDPAHPLPGELDLRFRVQLEPPLVPTVKVGVCNLGEADPQAVSGWDFLGRECKRTNFCQLVVDQDVALAGGLSAYDLVCLTGNGTFKADAAGTKALKAAIEGGMHMLIEALDPAAEKAFATLFEKLEVVFEPLPEGDSLLAAPYLFPAAPGGQVLHAQKLIYMPAGFSPAWSGKGATNRSNIRSAHEWGINLLNACLK